MGDYDTLPREAAILFRSIVLGIREKHNILPDEVSDDDFVGAVIELIDAGLAKITFDGAVFQLKLVGESNA